MEGSKKRPAPGGARGNAFEVLMSKSRRGPRTGIRQTPVGKSRFVLCPAGCGTHVIEHDINTHLDACIVKSEETVILSPDESDVIETHKDREVEPTTTVAEETPQADQAKGSCSVAVSPENVSKGNRSNGEHQNDAGPESDLPSTDNAFSHMMKQSHRVFSAEGLRPLQQRFHLHSDGHVSWTEKAPAANSVDAEPVCWSATVTLKGKRMGKFSDSEIPPRDLELTVSSSIPSLDVSSSSPGTAHRMVRSHSRLPVPVLKSILQKSVRRRRPLPSVRVSMELAEKSLSDLLRRVSIIMLEDSMLHPDLPFLVWLMVAHSKDFVVPPKLMCRVLQMVFEMASCPWTDCVQDIREADTDSNTNKSEVAPVDVLSSNIYLSSPLQSFQEEFRSSPVPCELMIRSMLLRALYGGMPCDTKMINQYVRLWRKRFFVQCVPTDVAQRLKKSRSGVQRHNSNVSPAPNEQLKWWSVPSLVHEKAKSQSAKYVEELVSIGIGRIIFKDVCVEGVDFHCSSVLDSILAGPNVHDTYFRELTHIMTQLGCSSIPAVTDHGRSWVTDVLKECMWNFSSGVNLRSPLQGADSKTIEKTSSMQRQELLRKFWDEKVAKNAQRFMKEYVEARLSR